MTDITKKVIIRHIIMLGKLVIKLVLNKKNK